MISLMTFLWLISWSGIQWLLMKSAWHDILCHDYFYHFNTYHTMTFNDIFFFKQHRYYPVMCLPVLSHLWCCISSVSSIGNWTWRDQSTSRQPLMATLVDQSLLGRRPKSLSTKYSTCLSWSTHLEAVRGNFLIGRRKAKVRDKSALKRWEHNYMHEWPTDI